MVPAEHLAAVVRTMSKRKSRVEANLGKGFEYATRIIFSM